VAGRKKGTDDYRDLWPEMFRLIQQVQPAWIIGENVANFINLAFTRTKSDLENEGYTVQSFIIPACAIGAPHRRDRVWIIAYRNSSAAQPPRCSAGTGGETPPSLQTQEQERNTQAVLHNGCAAVSGADVPNTHKPRLERCFRWTKRGLQPTYELFAQFWRRYENDLPKPTICRTDDGFSSRVDRLKSLGNSVVPQIPEIIGHAIIKTSKD
jgi:DNA (cytosine-5)-methyltransferase 1